jgi:aspartyl-tRNA(Asn)/glutamyl-tRNA(Gln) amidotransferase subunit C
MISKEKVKHIAKLARLSLTEKEIERMQKDLAKILDYVDKLKEVDISKTKPFSMKLENVFRKDEAKSKDFSEIKNLVEMAPEKKENYIKVKSVLK